MKKNLFMYLSLFTCLFGIVKAEAQFSQLSSYSIPGTGYVMTEVADIISSDAGSTVTLGRLNSATNDIILKKVGLGGAVLFNKVYTPSASVVLFAQKIIETKDHGYMVVGFYKSQAYYTAPFVAKFDGAGNFSWLKYYPSTAIYNAGTTSTRCGISLAGGDPNEDYVVVSTAGPDSASSYLYDDYLDALKIDSAGTLLWHNKYLPNWNRSAYYSIQDNVSAINYIPQSFSSHKFYGSSFFIAGTSRRQLSALTQFIMFYLGIDSAGNIIRPYTEYSTPGDAYNISSVFDNNTSVPASCLSYTLGNTGAINSYTASAIGLTKIDPFYNVFFTKYYYIPKTYATENYGYGIAKTQDADSGYVIGTLSYYNQPFPPTYHGTEMGILKVSQSGVPDFYNQYDTHLRWNGMVPIADVKMSGLEYYAAASTTFNATSTTADLGMVAADVNGYSCDTLHPGVADTSIYGVTTRRAYIAIQETGTFVDYLFDAGGQSTQITCNVPNAAFKYASPTAVPALNIKNELNIYPTLLSGNNSTVKIDFNTDAAGNLEISVYSVDGRVIGKKVFSVASGNNALTWDMPLLSQGNYILSVSTADNSFHKTVQVSKL